METVGVIVGIIVGVIGIIGALVGVIVKFARSDFRTDQLTDIIEELTKDLKTHIADKSVHSDAQVFKEFQINTNRRFDELGEQFKRMNDKLDKLLMRDGK